MTLNLDARSFIMNPITNGGYYMNGLSLIGWTSYDEDYPNINFEDYPQNEVFGLVLTAIKEGGYSFSGQDHQNRERCVPLFSNGCALRCSMRAWGLLMAAAHGQQDYMAYYMEAENPSYPDTKATAKRGDDNDALPVLIQPDQELILQTLEAGIDLVTTDKAILEMFPLYKGRYQEQNK